MRSKYFIQKLAILTFITLIGGCAIDEALQQAGNSFKGALTSDEGQIGVSNTRPVLLKIPNDPGIQKRKVTRDSTIIFRDVSYDNRVVTERTDAEYHRLRYENLTSNSFVVHLRIDNGVAGSGVKYGVSFNVQKPASGYQVKFQPTTRNAYQEGLIGKFSVPKFNDNDLRGLLSSPQIAYKFEVNSPYNAESITANFMRSAKFVNLPRDWIEPVTGKIFNRYFISQLRGKDMMYIAQIYPYRNGSKAVITAVITGVETSPGTVDFGVLIKEARQLLQGIAKS